MKKKPTKAQPTSPNPRDRYVLGLLIIFFAGFVYYKISELSFFKKGPAKPGIQKNGPDSIKENLNLTKIRVLINVSSADQQQQIAPLVDNFSRSMEEKGFKLLYSYASSNEERKRADHSEWDISLANSINALVMFRKNASLSILAAKNNCTIGTHLLVPNSSLLADINQLKQKKIYIFSGGTINPLLLKTANQLKDSRFEVINDQNVLMNKMNTEPDFVLLANTQSLEKSTQYPGLKELYVSPFKIPCRFMLASNKVPKPIIRKFLENADFSEKSLLNGYEIISEEQFGALFQSFPWKEISKLRAELLNKE